MDDDQKPRRPTSPAVCPVNLDDVDRSTYLRIKRIASRFVRRRVNPTLNATAVANEVWIRLKKSGPPLEVRDDAHFDALVAQAAGYVASDSARRRLSQKRDGGLRTDGGLDRQAARQASLDTILQVSQALADLEAEDAQTAGILRDFYFEGLTVAEIAAKCEISRRTVERALTLGRAWIHDRLTSVPDRSKQRP
jgi:RNA polymerase sigma factor (TIGR02999 family)